MSYDDEDADLDELAPAPMPTGPVVERTPADIERQVSAVSVDSPVDDVCAALDSADWLAARSKQIQRVARQIAIEWIDAHGEFDIGAIHYHVGHTTTIRCCDTKRCGLQLLDHLNGDFERFLEVLVAQPYKSTAARAILTQSVYGSLFTVKSSAKLVAGIPERVLKRTDKRFLR